MSVHDSWYADGRRFTPQINHNAISIIDEKVSHKLLEKIFKIFRNIYDSRRNYIYIYILCTKKYINLVYISI